MKLTKNKINLIYYFQVSFTLIYLLGLIVFQHCTGLLYVKSPKLGPLVDQKHHQTSRNWWHHPSWKGHSRIVRSLLGKKSAKHHLKHKVYVCALKDLPKNVSRMLSIINKVHTSSVTVTPIFFFFFRS